MSKHQIWGYSTFRQALYVFNICLTFFNIDIYADVTVINRGFLIVFRADKDDSHKI
jgi:hypothetical protein